MKMKCSFILKASLSLVLALLMLVGTVATSFAAVVDDAETAAEADSDLALTGADAEVAEEGADADIESVGTKNRDNGEYWHGKVYFRVPDAWNLTTYPNVYAVCRRSTTATNTSYTVFSKMSVVGNTSYSRLYSIDLDWNHWDWGYDEYIAFCASSDNSYGAWNTSVNGGGGGPYTQALDYGIDNTSGAYLIYPNTTASATTTTTNNPISGYYNATEANVMKYNTGSHSAYAYTNGSSSATGGTTSIKSYYLNGTTPSESTNTDSPTATYSSAMTGALTTFTATPKTNYEFKGWYSDSSLATLVSSSTSYTFYTYSNATAATPNKTLYAKFVTKPKITVSQTPVTGTVRIGGTTQTSAYVNSGASTALNITPPTGYTISNVTYTGTAPTWTTQSTSSYVGSVAPTADTTISVTYSETKKGVAVKVFSNGEQGTTGGNITIGSTNGANDGSNTINVGVTTSATLMKATVADGYTFTGWSVEGTNASHIKYSTNNSTWYTGANPKNLGTDTTLYIKTDGNANVSTSTAIVKAHFQKAHYLTVYNTTLFDRNHWVVLGSPPQSVKITSPNGTTRTYTYKSGTVTQRGEDDGPQHNGVATTTHNVTATGDYYEGNKLQYYAGDTIEMTYSALASSEIISGVFYNNHIRYTTELETDDLYTNRVWQGTTVEDGETVGAGQDDSLDYEYNADYAESEHEGYHALYANAKYYYDDIRETIEGVGDGYVAGVDQDTHTVSWVAGDQDYLNIDIELSSKREIHFSDTVNTVINSIHTDNYYYIGEDVSPNTTTATAANTLSIKAAGNANQTNTITKTSIKFYYCDNNGKYINPATGKTVSKDKRVQLTGNDATLTVNGSADSIANAGATDSTGFYYIDGTMPEYDVMVDLDLVVTYTLTLRSKIQSDTVGNKTAFGQVATLKMGSTTYNKNSNGCTTSTNCATGNYPAEQGVTLQVTGIDSGYMFVGWFLGTSSGPDLTTNPLSSSETFSYKPTKTTYIWAVGTRNIYITGSRHLFKDNADWQIHEMKFDATLGTKGKYYWEIDSTIFTGASNDFYTVDNGTTTTKDIKGYFKANDSTHPYWNTNANGTDNHGNAFFQFLNTNSGNYGYGDANYNKQLWYAIDGFESESSTIRYGKALPRDFDDNNYALTDGQGFIDFDETNYPGYSVPIRIYFDPANAGTFTVEPTPIYPHIHVSNGMKGVGDEVGESGTPSEVTIQVNSGTARGNNLTSVDHSSTSFMKFEGAGWSELNHEGHVSDIIVKARNAKLTLTKTLTSGDYEVSNFIVYNMTKKTVKAYPCTNTSGNTYKCDTIYTSDDDRLYIVPCVEYKGTTDKMTVVVDSSQLDYMEWGDLVGCYAWGSGNGGPRYGAYPGQVMVPSGDGMSWKATFRATNLTGITFTNYVDSGDGHGHTFLGESGVMGNVTSQSAGTATGGYVTVYNHIDSDDTQYSRTNFKAQTYDYREPVAFYKNKPAGATSTVLTFALKSGNGKLLSWQHSNLTTENILTYKTAHSTWDTLSWEYLTDSSGKNYADLNGYVLPEKPTASFYIAAKAMVQYSDNSMTKVFHNGKSYDTTTGISYNDYKYKTASEIDMDYAVQWYIYDASGKYITNVLSAGNADITSKNSSGNSVVTQTLLDLGYAVEGRSVKICYDIPRYCFDNTGGLNQGSSFNAYRFTGQWYEDSQYKTAKVYAKVGIMSDNGATIADESSAAYGSATVSVDSTLCSIPSHQGTGTEEGIDYGYTAVVDGDNGAITLTASTTNFIGWYHYDNEGKLVQDTDKNHPTLTPSYSKDSTYIALYEAKAVFSYNYQGREGDKSYGKGSSLYLDEDEIAAGNLVKTDAAHLTEATNAVNYPGSGTVDIFKKTFTWKTGNSLTTANLSATKEYILDVNDAYTLTPTQFTLNYQYKDASGNVQTKSTSGVYNGDPVVLTDTATGKPCASLYSGQGAFIGWYDYSNNTVGNLITTQRNFGMRIVKNQSIIAVYENDGNHKTAPDTNNVWKVSIEDQEVTREMYSGDTGTIYNDTIVRVTNNSQRDGEIDGNVSLPAKAEVGVIVIDNNASNSAYDHISITNLTTIANALNGNGATRIISSTTGAKATKLCSSSVNNFGRKDYALRGSYSNLNGHKYAIYAYIKTDDGYVFCDTVKSGTYSFS